MAERYVDPVREYLKRQHLEAEYECRTAHKAIKRGAADKTAIKKAIKAGKEVAGAHLETSKSVIVR